MLYLHLIYTALRTRQLGREVTCLPATGSTNDDLWRLVESGKAVPGQVVVTDHQSHGRGRQGRSWFQGAGRGLPFSVLLYPALPRECLGLIPLATGVAVVEALAMEGVAAGLKWPNDILADGERKLGGILSESRRTDRGLAVVIGIGLNVNEQAGDFPAELRASAVSVRMLLGRTIQRELLLAGILNRLERLLDGDPAEVPDLWLERCTHRDGNVRFRGPEGETGGRFIGVDERGRARIEVEGKIHRLSGGELLLQG